MAHLLVESGVDKRKLFALTGKSKFVCGRSPRADVVINDPFASGQHFGLLYKEGYWYIQDLNSSNGIELNEEKITTSKLGDGDLIRVGSTYLRFVDPPENSEDDGQPANFPRVSGYDVIGRLGVGGMGEVFRARQVSLDREVALKILFKHLTRDREFVQKFFQEARAAGNLNHPNIVQVHDVGDDNGVCFICMEYVSGGNLTDMLRKQGMLDQSTAVRIAKEVARGLAYAQSKKLVHCDIKPDNIMFNDIGMAKIADLGIARNMTDKQTQQKEVLGSPHYMAPEQAMGKPVDHRADLYSLGCTMYRMLAGRTPFSGTSAREVMKKQVKEEAPDITKLSPGISPELADVIDALMEKNPDKRIQSANELINLLEKIENGTAASNSKPKPATPQRNTRRASAKLVSRTRMTGRVAATGRTVRRKPVTGGGMVSAAVSLVIALVVGYFVFNLAVDYKPRTAYEKAEKLANGRDYEQAFRVLNDAPVARDQELENKIKKLREDVKHRMDEEKEDEKREALNAAFTSQWSVYDRMRNKPAKKGQKKRLLEQLDKLEEAFKDDADKMTLIRTEKDRVGLLAD